VTKPPGELPNHLPKRVETMSYVVERLEVTDEERQAARRELDELVDRYGPLLPPYLASRFGREVELSAMKRRPVSRETAVVALIYDTEYLPQESDSPSEEGQRS
jgi:hypothetical protein